MRDRASAKDAEARNALGRMGKDAAAAFERETTQNAQVIPAGSGAAVSSHAVCLTEPGNPVRALTVVIGKADQSKTTDWLQGTASEGFHCLKFTIRTPQTFAYSYTASGSGTGNDAFTASANGDINGNGTMSTYSLGGNVQNGAMNLAPDTMVVNARQ